MTQEAMVAQAPGDVAIRTDREWLSVAAATIGLIFSVGTLTVYTFGVFAGPLGKEFGWSRPELFNAVAFSQYALALSSPFWGILSDRFAMRKVILTAVVLQAVTFGSLALLTPNLWHLYGIYILFPILAGATGPLGYSAVIVRKFSGHLGLALGFALMGVGLGALLLPIVSQALIDNYGWRGAYEGLGILSLVVGLPAAWIATRGLTVDPVAKTKIEKSEAPSIWPLIGTRAYLLMCLLFIMIGVISVGMLVHIVPLLKDAGIAPPVAAGVASAAGAATLIGRGGMGWILDKVHASFVLAAIALIGVVGFLLFAYGSGLPTYYLAAVCVGIVVGAEVDFVSFLVRRYFDMSVYGRLYGIAFGLFIVGSGLGPQILANVFGTYHSYVPGLQAFAVVGVLIAVLAFALPKYTRPVQGH